MKGLFLRNQIEYKVELFGEEWRQGDLIKGEFQITNHSTDSQLIPEIDINFKQCLIKDVRSDKSDKNLSLNQQVFSDSLVLKSGEGHKIPFDFRLPLETTITDSKTSLYMFYGTPDKKESLQLSIVPQMRFEEVINTMGTFFRFTVKKKRSQKDWVEYTLKAPLSKDLACLEDLKLLINLGSDKILQLHFQAKIKKVDFAAPSAGHDLSFKMDTFDKKYQLSPEDYLFYGRDFHQDKFKEFFSKTLSEIVGKPFLSL